jgi:hypothetical protein
VEAMDPAVSVEDHQEGKEYLEFEQAWTSCLFEIPFGSGRTKLGVLRLDAKMPTARRLFKLDADTLAAARQRISHSRTKVRTGMSGIDSNIASVRCTTSREENARASSPCSLLHARSDSNYGSTDKRSNICKSWLYRTSNEIVCSTQKIFQRNRPGALAYEWAGIRFWLARLTKAALF